MTATNGNLDDEGRGDQARQRGCHTDDETNPRHPDVQWQLPELKEGIEGIRVMGPSPAFIHRLRGEYRWQVTLKGDGLERARHLAPRGKGWSYDVDPVT